MSGLQGRCEKEGNGMRRLDKPQDHQIRAYVVPWEDGNVKGWKVWRPDWIPHLSVLVWAKESEAQAKAERINRELTEKGFA